MEIINPCYSVITNHEVLESLKSLKDTKKKAGLRNLATITYETIQYLSEENSPATYQKRGDIEAFLHEIKPFQLTMQECLNIVNNPPTSALHIQLLIEDSEERLSEEQVNQIIEISRLFIGPPVEEDAEAADGQEEEDETGNAEHNA